MRLTCGDKFGGSVGSSDAGVGLALAMLEVLYNGGFNYGTLNNSQTPFSPPISPTPRLRLPTKAT